VASGLVTERGSASGKAARVAADRGGYSVASGAARAAPEQVICVSDARGRVGSPTPDFAE